MSKTCLVVIYNHQYIANIEKLEKLYKNKFDKIYHIMPFYTGDKDNVISIYENSYQFSNYVTQAFEKFYSDEYDYYAFMGDDVLLNPKLRSNTIEEMLQINQDTAFTARDLYVMDNKYFLTRIWLFPSILNYMYSDDRKTIDKILPDIEDMVEKYKLLGIKPVLTSEDKIEFLQDFLPVSRQHNFYYKYSPSRADENLDYKKLLNSYKDKENESIKYLFPFACGFSDFFVIPKNYVKKFSYYAGVLASQRIFAEVAVPTSLCIVMNKISMPTDIGLNIINFTSTDKERVELPERYNKSVKRFIEDWDESNLLVHPIKYSIWEVDIEE